MSEHAFWVHVFSLYKLFQNNRILLAYKPKSSQNYDKGDRVFLHRRLFVCLFEVFVPLGNFSLIWRCHQYRWKAANLTYTWHWWLLSSESFLAWHTYCDTGHPFIMVIFEDPWQSHYCRAFGSGVVTTCFYDLGLLLLGF